MTPAKIYVSARDLFKVKDFLNNNQKIDAIKYLRDAARGYRPGLAEAKDAVEHLMSPHALPDPRGVIAPLNPIKAVTIDLGALGGEGDVTIDMDSVEFHFDVALNKIGIEKVNALMSLYKRLASWEDEVLEQTKNSM